MKTFDPAPQAHFDEGTSFGFTDHDRTLSLIGADFEPESGLTASEMRSGLTCPSMRRTPRAC